MARPKKDNRDRRVRTIIFRVTEADYVRLCQKAASASLGVNALARKLALSRVAVVKIETVEVADPALLSQLSRLGNLLNQLTARAHVSGRVPSSVEGLCEQISEIVIEAAERNWKDGA